MAAAQPLRAIPVVATTGSAGSDTQIQPSKSVLLELCKSNSCTVEDMQQIFDDYRGKHQSDLNLNQFALLYSLKQNRRLVFERPELIYRAFCEEGKTISLESFRRLAPALSNPPVTKLNADRIHAALLVDDDLGILFKEFEAWIAAHKEQEALLPAAWPNPNKHLPLDPNAGKPELLVSRGRAVELSGAVPTLGKLLLTSTHILFESSMFKNRVVIAYTQILKLELRTATSFFGKRGGIRVTVQDKTKTATYLWDFPSIGGSDSVNERHRTFVYIRDLMAAHRLIQEEPDRTTAVFVLKEVCQTVRAMRALEAVETADPLSLSPLHDRPRLSVRQRVEDAKRLPPGRVITDSPALTEDEAFGPEEPPSVNPRRRELELAFLERVRNEIKRQLSIRDSKSPWLYKILPGLQAKDVRDEELKQDVDPEHHVDVAEPTGAAKAVRDKFSVKKFRDEVVLFRHQIQVLFLAAAAYRALKSWDHPALSAFTALFLLNLAYQDLLSFLPALFLACNALLLLLLRSNPDLFRDDPSAAAPAASAAAARSADTATPAVAAGSVPSAPSKASAAGGEHEPSAPGGILGKVRGYYETAIAAKDGLESAQNSLAEVNQVFLKIEGLYKWAAEPPSRKFLLYNIIGFFAMAFLPFRIVFSLAVVDVFTSRWQRPGSAFSRLLAQVPAQKVHHTVG